MQKDLLFLLIGSLLVACSVPENPVSPSFIPIPPTSDPVGSTESSKWILVWEDEFEGENLDPENWIVETGAGGWGNNEWQHYTDRPENVRLEDGLLIIEAREEDYRGNDYTSARLKTQSLHSWTYGRFEARMKLPTGQGIWSAFWMLGEDYPSLGWPACGEIDIMENIGEPQIVLGTVHGPGYSGGEGVGTSFKVNGDPLFEEFRTYAIEWAPGEIRWYVDNSLFNIITEDQLSGKWVFNHPFFIILNLAVGGNLPGYPDDTTQFPQQLVVDHVRVFRDPTLSLEDLQGEMLHISEISLDLEEKDGKWVGSAFVTVLDSKGNPVEGVDVTAGWLGVVTGATKTATTDEKGVAGPLIGQKTSFAEEITFCVSDLSKASYTYNEDQNSRTCAFAAPLTLKQLIRSDKWIKIVIH